MCQINASIDKELGEYHSVTMKEKRKIHLAQMIVQQEYRAAGERKKEKEKIENLT